MSILCPVDGRFCISASETFPCRKCEMTPTIGYELNSSQKCYIKVRCRTFHKPKRLEVATKVLI